MTWRLTASTTGRTEAGSPSYRRSIRTREGVADANHPSAIVAIQVTNGGSRCIVQLCGELDLGSAPACREALDAILDEREADLLIDLRGLTFLDSMGLSALLDADIVGPERGRRVSFFRVIAPSSVSSRSRRWMSGSSGPTTPNAYYRAQHETLP